MVDFDAYNYYSDRAKGKYYEFYLNKCKRDGLKPTRKLIDFLNIKNMKDVCNCPFMAGGHAFVLKMLLQGDIDVVHGEVVDNCGVLDFSELGVDIMSTPFLGKKRNSWFCYRLYQ